MITTVPSADRQKATVRVRIGFDAERSTKGREASTRESLPDMGVKVSFLTKRRRGGRARRPRAQAGWCRMRRCAPRTAGPSCSWCGRTGRAARHQCRRREGDQVEVLSGVNAGERVVVEGHDDARGRRARVKEQ